jgi:S-formylglutathione hydrolase FrmB
LALKRQPWPDGQLTVVEFDSRVLAGNPLGDPHRRRFPVWLPPGYSSSTRKRRYPVLFDLTGYTGSGWSHTNWRNFDENVPDRLARLVHQRRMRACIVVFPDCFTALGGNQYVNSSAIGRYADYLTRELVPFVDGEFRTLAERDHRGCFGKSSGGYGALVHGMRYPRCWGAVASHSGDVYFDFIYRAEWPAALTELGRYRHPQRIAGPWLESRNKGLAEGRDDGRVQRFLDSVWRRERLSGHEITTLMMVCMAATYDPDPAAPNGFRLPFHLETGELLPQRWRAWLRHDPLRLARRYARNLKTLRGLYLDCGWRDQYHIHFGSRILSRVLNEAGVKHVYEEFDGTHSGVDHRMDVSLPFLSRALG